MMTILLVITFIFGVVRLLTFTKLFTKSLIGIVEVFIPNIEEVPFLIYIDYLFFYFSLCFQSWFWIFRHIEF